MITLVYWVSVHAGCSIRGAIEYEKAFEEADAIPVFYNGIEDITKLGLYSFTGENAPTGLLICQQIVPATSDITFGMTACFRVPAAMPYSYYTLQTRDGKTVAEPGILREEQLVPSHTIIVYAESRHVKAVVDWGITIADCVLVPKIILAIEAQRNATRLLATSLDITPLHESAPCMHQG